MSSPYIGNPPKPLVDEAVRLCERQGLVTGLVSGWLYVPELWASNTQSCRDDCRHAFKRYYTTAGLLRFIAIASAQDTENVTDKLCRRAKEETYE